MTAQCAYFERLYPVETSANKIKHPAAAAMAALLSSHTYAGAQIIESRSGNEAFPDGCLLVIDVEVALGQRKTVNDIKVVERIALVYTRPDVLPSVCPLRDDFPMDVPHLNLTVLDQPRSLCLFEMPREEALRLATPFVLIERVRFWLKETAYGRLHGDNQPLDPIFASSWQPIVLPTPDTVSGDTGLFYGRRASDHDGCPVFLEAADEVDNGKRLHRAISGIVIVTKPLLHARLRAVPLNVGDLLEAFESMQINLLGDLQAVLRTWPSKPRLNDLMRQQCLIIVRTPIERFPGSIGGEATKAFLTECPAGELAERLGAFCQDDGFAGRFIAPPPVDFAALKKLTLLPMDVHHPFTRAIAQAASGSVIDVSTPTRSH